MQTLNGTVRFLIDNWMLELACSSVAGQVRIGDFEGRGRVRIQNGAYPGFADDGSPVEHVATAILGTLELLLLVDEIMFDTGWSRLWFALTEAEPLRDILVPVDIPDEIRVKLSGPLAQYSPDCDLEAFHTAIIEGGARYYLELGRALGASYWPSPRRSAYLANTSYQSIAQNSPLVFSDLIEEATQRAIAEALKAMKIQSPVRFFGLGSSILVNCDRRESVFSTALQIRNTKECRGFRKWMAEVDHAFDIGDAIAIAKALRLLDDVLSDLRKRLRVDPATLPVDLQIGLSPSLKLGPDLLKTVVKWIRPKPYHFLFLRGRAFDIARNTNVASHLYRVFPELKGDVPLLG